MHIPENYLSPSTCAVMAAAMVPVWIYSVKKVKEEIPKVKMPLLGIGAAFSFLGMMFNIPLPGGTTGHAVGGTLIAILTGSPSAGCIAVTIALLIQALLFGDGGILAFGANCFNMAFILPFLGFAIYKLIWEKTGKRKLAAGIGSYIGINAAAFCAAIEFGIQPLLFTDAAGKAYYFYSGNDDWTSYIIWNCRNSSYYSNPCICGKDITGNIRGKTSTVRI
jgi:cobalt/nickel transport system permease protein